MKKLWQKNWEMDKIVENFETQSDLLMDQKLIPYDVYGSVAQAKMLCKIGILTNEELSKTLAGLTEIIDLYEKGKFNLEPSDEDMHTKIESFLTESLGEIGKKIHTGRSRNDQVLLAIRLYVKDMLLQIWEAETQLAGDFQAFAKKHEFVPMPGFTHTQKAMPSSVGMWSASFVESLIDDMSTLESSFKLNDKSPLGSAAGYGVPMPIDRPYIAEILGFEQVQINPIYCQNSRGKIEASTIASLNSVLMTINKFATDMVFFTTSELNYFQVADELCSGSSIMPQKRNIDIAELLRSKTHGLVANYVQMTGIASNLISGYNRDLQDTKKVLIESLENTLEAIKIANILINNIQPKEENLIKALTPEIFATHNALTLVLQGSSFRDAYHKVGNDQDFQKPTDITKELTKSTHLGGTGNLGLAKYDKTLTKAKSDLTNKHDKYEEIINSLFLS
jgi:argininosuccinate lyase